MVVRWLCTIGALGAVLVFPAVADASLQVTLTAGASSTTIVDGGAGDSDATVNQIINISTIVGGYNFLVTLVTSNSPGTPLLAFLNGATNSISDVGGGASTVSVYASANGYTAPTSFVVAQSGSTAQFLSPTPSGNTATVSYSALIDPSDLMTTVPSGFAVGGGSAVITQPGSNNAALSSSSAGVPPPAYALNLFLSATLDQGGSTIDLDGQVSLSAVPEPATVVVWSLLGILGAVVGRKIARQRS